VLEEPIHFFDLARWYLEGSGDPVELYAYGNSRDPQRPTLFDNFSAMFKYPNGSYAVVSQTLAAFEHHQTVKVSGTKGALWAGWSGALDRTLEPDYFLKVFDGENLEHRQNRKAQRRSLRTPRRDRPMHRDGPQRQETHRHRPRRPLERRPVPRRRRIDP
jgi:predicted dehydrogenase